MGLALGLGACVSDASAEDAVPEIFPLEKIRRGQTGYGLTTMQGTTPERFTFEVIGVNRNFLPKMDIILVKSDDPKLAIPGFWKGMSGSPLFIDGKVACAFSYGFRFNKLSIGGCTPIQYMKDEGFTDRRRSPAHQNGRVTSKSAARTAAGRALGGSTYATSRTADWLRLAPEETVDSAMRRTDGASGRASSWLSRLPVPRLAPRQTGGQNSDEGMTASAVPLAMSGFSAPAFARAKELLGDFPVEPMRAGGTGDANSGPKKFQLGAPIGVQLVRGDMSIDGTGTVSYMQGDRVLAFGHPMFQAGELYAPVTAAEIHTVIPSALSAFIVASPLRELGSLVQDRQSTIMADTSLETQMIPFDIYIESNSPGASVDKREFHVEILNNRFLTGSLSSLAAMNAMSVFLPDRDHVTVYIESTVHVRGYQPLSFVDYLYSNSGADSVMAGARGLRAVPLLLNNPFAPVQLERVELRAKILFDINYGEIRDVALARAELLPGQRNYATVYLTTYDGQDIVERVPFDVPESMAGSIARLEITAGDDAALDIAPPQSIDDIMTALRKLLPGNIVAVTLYSADEGVAVDGKLVRDLPPSALDRLRPRSASHRAQLYNPIARSTYPTKRVLQGKHTMLVKIADQTATKSSKR
jgi:hypothetical protein